MAGLLPATSPSIRNAICGAGNSPRSANKQRGGIGVVGRKRNDPGASWRNSRLMLYLKDIAQRLTKIFNHLHPFSTTCTESQQLSAAGSNSESLLGPSSCFGRFLFAIFWRGGGFQRTQQTRRYGRHFFHGFLKRSLVGLRWFVEAGDLADKLQRSRANLVLVDRRVEVEQGFDIPTHAARPRARNLKAARNILT
jgi:hypothetical protein